MSPTKRPPINIQLVMSFLQLCHLQGIVAAPPPPTVSPDDDTPPFVMSVSPSAPATDVRLIDRPAVGRCQPLPIRPTEQPHVRVEEGTVGVDLVLRVVHVLGVDGCAGPVAVVGVESPPQPDVGGLLSRGQDGVHVAGAVCILGEDV